MNFLSRFGPHKDVYKLNRQPLRILGRLKQAPTRQDRKLCDAYANDVLGSRFFAPYLYLYSTISGSFKEGWIPDSYYKKYIVSPSSYTLSDMRGMLGRLMGYEHLPDIANWTEGRLTTPEANMIPLENVEKHLFADSNSVVFKVDRSSSGKGITFLTRRDFSVEWLKEQPDGIFQTCVRQHDLLAHLSPLATATLRLTTAMNSYGEATVRAAYLRIGRSNDRLIRSKTHLRINCDPKEGILDERGYMPDWTSVSAHPDTGEVFAGRKLPAFKDATQLVARLHNRFPYVDCIGWDIAIDEQGHVKLLEWNTKHNDIKMSEAVKGPCFADLDWHNRWKRS